jgi:hypothetical protein
MAFSAKLVALMLKMGCDIWLWSENHVALNPWDHNGIFMGFLMGLSWDYDGIIIGPH